MKIAIVVGFFLGYFEVVNGQLIIEKCDSKKFILELTNNTSDTMYCFNPLATLNTNKSLKKLTIDSKRIERAEPVDSLIIYMNDTSIHWSGVGKDDVFDAERKQLGLWNYIPLFPSQKIKITVFFPVKLSYRVLKVVYSLENKNISAFCWCGRGKFH